MNLRRKTVIGLMGGIGSGKSTVAKIMASLGCAVVDADQLARKALDEADIRDRLVQWWGPEVLDAQGHVSRQAVARRVFADEAELRRLEGLIHPRVLARRARLIEQYQADPAVKAIVDDTPLLLEKGLDGDCDLLIFVDASRETRLARVEANRGWSPQELARREEKQLGLDIKARRADHVIDNNAGEAQCSSHVRRVLSQIFQQEV